jgi:hypothetical protein
MSHFDEWQLTPYGWRRIPACNCYQGRVCDECREQARIRRDNKLAARRTLLAAGWSQAAIAAVIKKD